MTIVNKHLQILDINAPRFLCSYCLGATNEVNSLENLRFFSNCDTDKKYIFAMAKDLKDKGVIYCWINNLDNKRYVGSSTNLTARLYKYYNLKHLLKNKSVISNALCKYGYSKFSLHILEVCDKSKCIEREQYYIDLLNPEYNILKLAGSSLGYKHNEETRKWFLEKRKVSDDTRKNLS